MVNRQERVHHVYRRLGWKLLASTAIVIAAAGCTKTAKKDSPQAKLAAFNYSKQAHRDPLQPNHPMHIAAAKWARKHQKNPADTDAAVNYIRSLKAIGSKELALEVAERTYQLNPNDPELASEYGRLALDQGKVQQAEQLLDRAMRAKGTPDWKTLSAMGTVQAKRGDHAKAQSFYLAALKQRPGATSVYNNLALSYALDGKAGQAEKLLKDAVSKGHNTQVVRQNLALVLGIQSKFDEAQQVAQADLDNSRIDNNETFLRKMVKTTKVAKAPKRKQSVQMAKVDTTTTGALPAKTSPAPTRVTPARQEAAPSASAKAVASLPARKPKAPAKAAPEIARNLTAAQKAEMARPLPWETKSKEPGKPKAPDKKTAPETRSAQKTDEKKLEKTDVAALDRKTGSTWTVTVHEAVGSDSSPAPQPASKKPFRFPAPSE